MIGIIGALGLEINLIKEKMTDIKTYEYAGMNYFEGLLSDKKVVLTTCGVGKVNAAIFTQVMINKFDINYIIHTGIAGGMANNIKRGDLVIADDITYHDVRPAQMKSLFPFCESFKSDAELVLRAKNACEGIYDYHIGRIVTGDAFIADNKLKSIIKEIYNPQCVEMEGAAVAHACHVNDKPFVVIRCISDNADDDAEFDYAKFEKLAADKAACVVTSMVTTMESRELRKKII